MSRYDILLVTDAGIRLSGIVTANSLTDAVAVVERETAIRAGDRLLVGVGGFPPLWLRCTGVERRADALHPSWCAEGEDGRVGPLLVSPVHGPAVRWAA